MTRAEIAKEMFLRARDLPNYEEIVARSIQRLETPYGVIDGNGVNVSIIQERLAMTVEERLRTAQEGMSRMMATRYRRDRAD